MDSSQRDESGVSDVKGSSNRSFGLVFTGFFALVGIWSFLGGGGVRLWALGLALGCLVLALAWPAMLALPNRLWTKLGLLLHRLTSPVLLAVLFFGMIAPMGLLMRLLGKRPLNLPFDSSLSS